MSTWYKLGRWGKLQSVEVESSTKEFVKLVGQGRRQSKTTDWSVIRESKRECFEWLIDLLTREVEWTERTLKTRQEALSEARKEAKRNGVYL